MVDITRASARLVERSWAACAGSRIAPLICPTWGQAALGHDLRPRRWRHLSTTQWKAFLTATAQRVNYPKRWTKQVRVTWAKDHSRFTRPNDTFANQAIKAMRRKAQEQWLKALPLASPNMALDENDFGRDHDTASVLHDVCGRWALDIALGAARREPVLSGGKFCQPCARASGRRWTDGTMTHRSPERPRPRPPSFTTIPCSLGIEQHRRLRALTRASGIETSRSRDAHQNAVPVDQIHRKPGNR